MQDKPKGQWCWFDHASLECDLGSDHIRLVVGPDAYSLSNVKVQKPAQTFWTTVLSLARQHHDSSLWTVQLGMGGPQNQLQGYNLGGTYRLSF